MKDFLSIPDTPDFNLGEGNEFSSCGRFDLTIDVPPVKIHVTYHLEASTLIPGPDDDEPDNGFPPEGI